MELILISQLRLHTNLLGGGER